MESDKIKKLNPYQRIIVNGELIQEGDMNTPVKFEQLTQGIDLKGKRVLDVGCNLGMICSLAKGAGAIVKGIDINIGYINQARSLFPDINFECQTADNITGDYDIVIASAMLHYVDSLDKVFKLFARHSKQVLCDIWLNDEVTPVFILSHRGIYIPSRSAFIGIVGKYFRVVEEKGIAITPDISKRYIFHLSEPIRPLPEAVLIYGEGGSGKTTLARAYSEHKHFMTDNLFGTWKVYNMDMMFSAGFFSNLSRGVLRTDYINTLIKILESWLNGCVNSDIVIEGYELVHEDFRGLVVNLLISKGWKITQIEKIKDF